MGIMAWGDKLVGAWRILSADPCRVFAWLFDTRTLRTLVHNYRHPGGPGLLAELPERTAPDPKPLFTPNPGNAGGRILVIDRSLPQYDRDAGSRSSYKYLLLFLEMGLETWFLPHDRLRREPYASELDKLGVRILAGRRYGCGGWKRWLRNQSAEVDVVFIHRPNIAIHYLPFIRSTIPEMRICYCGHDLRYVRDRRCHEATGEHFYLRESRYWKQLELKICQLADVVYMFSDAETEALRRHLPEIQARTIPLYPMQREPCTEGPSFAERSGLLFVGGFTHAPNRDALLWYVREILPKLQAQGLQARLHVVGANPPPEIRVLDSRQLSIEGAVSDRRLAQLYASCRVVIAPLRFGAGVKGKVVEAMDRAVPTVTTDIGAEGIDDAEKLLVIGNSASDFATHLLELYRIPGLWEEVRRRLAGRRGLAVNHDDLQRLLLRDFRLHVPEPEGPAATTTAD